MTTEVKKKNNPRLSIILEALKHTYSVPDYMTWEEYTQEFPEHQKQIKSVDDIKEIINFTIQKTEKWAREDEQLKENIFINHIQQHLNAEQKVICKICNKTVEEIYSESAKITLGKNSRRGLRNEF